MNPVCWLTMSNARVLIACFLLIATTVALPARANDWCRLLSLSEVSAAVGKPVLASSEVPIGKEQGICSYFSDAKKMILVAAVQVYTKQGKMYYSLFCETAKGDVKPGLPIKDVGDQACFKPDTVLIARKGERLIHIAIGVMGGKPEQVIPLTKAALARM